MKVKKQEQILLIKRKDQEKPLIRGHNPHVLQKTNSSPIGHRHDYYEQKWEKEFMCYPFYL